jgi:hypothetical protein
LLVGTWRDDADMTSDEDRIRGIVASSPWLMRVLATVASSGLPDAWVGAGVLRDLVWGQLYGSGFTPAQVHDVDVVFFDPRDQSRGRDDQATEQLRRACPGVPWEAKNQAAVHTWYHAKFGGEPVAALDSIADAVATWPETATAVAVRLPAGEAPAAAGEAPAAGGAAPEQDARIEVCAPLGLADLLGGVWRRNPRRVSLDVSLARLARHQPARRWPGVSVIPPS